MFSSFRRTDPQYVAARSLYKAIVSQARTKTFHMELKVPDNFDGRFDLLALHVFVVMEALKGCGEDGAAVGKHLVNLVFESLEEALRDLGVGDLGLSRRIKAMADAFYGRLEAYRASLGSQQAMAKSLVRNLYRGEGARQVEALALAGYVLACVEDLKRSDPDSILLQGHTRFARLPEI